MGTWKDAFPGNWLKAEDLKGHRIAVRITKLGMEDIADEQKLVIRFDGKEKGLVCNKTNAQSIADIVGSDDIDKWLGQTVILFPTVTDFQGRRVACIRVDPPGAGTKPLPPPPPPEELSESDIPFAWLLPLLVSGAAWLI